MHPVFGNLGLVCLNSRRYGVEIDGFVDADSTSETSFPIYILSELKATIQKP